MHLDDEQTAFETARVVVVPVPFDATTCYRPGTREGPQAIIDASRNLELYDAELRRWPSCRHPYAARGRTSDGERHGDGQSHRAGDRRVARPWQIRRHARRRPLISIGVIRAFAARYPHDVGLAD